MVTVQRSALLVGFDPATAERLGDDLRKAVFFSEWVDSAEAALDLIQLLPFDAVIVGYPLAGLSMEKFLQAVRRENSPCRHAAVAIVAGPGRLEDAHQFVGRGANGSVTMEDAAEQLPHLLFRLIEVPPRFSLRAVSRVKVQLGRGPSLTLCQTENVSLTGMLLRTDQSYPIGTKLGFEMTLPGDGRPIRGAAVVVRHTHQPHERVSGIGVRFADFEGSDRRRFEEHLQALAGRT